MASKSSSFFSALCLLVLSVRCVFGLERFEAVEPHMGSMVRIVAYADDQASARRAFQAAFARVEELDRILSDYRPDSELNRLCVARTAIVSPDLFRVLQVSQRLAEESDGAFDITAGPLIRLWREARRSKILPDARVIEAARTLTGWRQLILHPKTRRATLAQAGMQLDVGGIAKGYVAEEAILVLKRSGIQRALVAASGDIIVTNPPPGKAGWDVTLELLGGTREISIRNAAVSTAGDTEQFFEWEGTRYSHILDPRTGRPLTGRIGVSVVARHGLEADGLDTTISALGARRGLALMKRHRRAWALIVTEQGAFSSGKKDKLLTYGRSKK